MTKHLRSAPVLGRSDIRTGKPVGNHGASPSVQLSAPEDGRTPQVSVIASRCCAHFRQDSERCRTEASRWIRWWWLAAWMVAVFSSSIASAGETATNEPARVKVSGFGFLGNREMVRLLKNFQPDGKLPPVVDRTFVEDATLVLFARAQGAGYLNARLQARFTFLDGNQQQLVWTNALEAQLPREFAAREVRFRMKRGLRFYYESIEIEGIKAIPEREAKSYFVSGDTLIRLRSTRSYNPESLRSSMDALKDALARKGYRSSVVDTNKVTVDPASGEVIVELKVEQGLVTMVRSVSVTVEGIEDDTGTNFWTLHPDKPYSHLWEQNLARQLQEQQFTNGYPDAAVTFRILQRETNAANIQIDMAARVNVGPRVRVGEVLYSGNKRIRQSVLDSRVELDEGDLLNRIEAERSRQRLARLGIFESVGLRYEQVDATTRNVLYEFKESKPLSLSLLAGYGSYELLRGGLEFEHRNVWGMAHDARLRAIQSFKSSSGDFQYTIPEVFGENLNVFARGAGLRRDEVSFTRKEYGGSVGLQKRLDPIQTHLSAHYDYEFLDASGRKSSDTNRTRLGAARSAALVLDLNRDRRETPLMPESGLKLFGKFEAASAALGGNVDYQRAIVGASYHIDLRGGRLLHLGVTHGMSFTRGSSPEELPFNKRFFPGGQNSVRGYQDGEASPLDAKGNQLGAETYTQGNFEFEQLLTKSWSLVTFIDAVGFARDRNDYPWDEALYSVGGGIRWLSLIGPVRLEYGHNLNPRDHDPSGTVHFSIGFPF